MATLSRSESMDLGDQPRGSATHIVGREPASSSSSPDPRLPDLASVSMHCSKQAAASALSCSLKSSTTEPSFSRRGTTAADPGLPQPNLLAPSFKHSRQLTSRSMRLVASYATRMRKGQRPARPSTSCDRRSFVVAGQLDQLRGASGVHTDKYRSFELYRRNLYEPEIVTFDECSRARSGTSRWRKASPQPTSDRTVRRTAAVAGRDAREATAPPLLLSREPGETPGGRALQERGHQSRFSTNPALARAPIVCRRVPPIRPQR